MNERALKTLEYYKVIDMLKEEAQSSLAKKLCEQLVPIDDLDALERLHEETDEALRLLIQKGQPPLHGISNIRPETRRAEMGGSLTPGGLLKVADSLRAARQLKAYGKEVSDETEAEFPYISDIISILYTNRQIEDEVDHAIVNEDTIADSASPRLASIRKRIVRKNEEIRDKISSLLNAQENKKHLQDSIVTIRDGRFCIPVKQENKGFVPGIVHDMSASGATVFIEPMAVVNMNNELRALEAEEKEEIERILRELSALVGERAEEIESNQDLLVSLDFIFAKGRLALRMNATKPKLNYAGCLHLKKARHPLLDPKKVVPTDVWLGKDFKSLIITGPNTGGKTVTLKTVGLLELMAMAGLHIPADEHSEVAVFNEVFADIGDEQSIEQSLSTFSSHLTNIVRILKNLQVNSLVLFDELGAGTDPTEGAALAMSILDHLLKLNVATMATTHYSQLKLYALTTEGVRNASVEFDVETLRPTYRLLIGVPGKSNAFEISRRLGLPEDIIEDARKLIDNENLEFEDVLSALESDRKTAERNREEAERTQREVEELKVELEKRKERMEEIREKALREAREEARQLVRNAKQEADELLVTLREHADLVEKERMKRSEESRERLKRSLEEKNRELAVNLTAKVSKEPPKNLKLGDTVEVLSYDTKGIVVSLPDEEGNLQVKVGIVKISTNVANLKRAQEEKVKVTRASGAVAGKSRFVDPELDIRGKNVDEACLEIDKYLDDAFLSGLKKVSIIHGKGTGALRQGVRDYLKHHRYVESLRAGGFNEGGDGVSVIEMREK